MNRPRLAGMNTCIQCGRTFDASWVIEYGGGPVELVEFCSTDCSIKHYSKNN